MNISSLLPAGFLSSLNAGPKSDDIAGNVSERPSFNKLNDDKVTLSQQAKVAYSQQSASQGNIEILTRDGDKVTISLSSSSSYQSRYQYSDVQTQDARLTQYRASESLQLSSQFDIRIEGNIDAEEREAIDDLINNISDISEQLYQGNIESAFKQASSLEYDTEELQAYSFDFTQINTRQYIAVYEEVARIPQSDTEKGDTEKVEASDFNNDLMSLLKDLAANTIESLNEFLDTEQLQSLVGQAAEFFEENIIPQSVSAKDKLELLERDEDLG